MKKGMGALRRDKNKAKIEMDLFVNFFVWLN